MQKLSQQSVIPQHATYESVETVEKWAQGGRRVQEYLNDKYVSQKCPQGVKGGKIAGAFSMRYSMASDFPAMSANSRLGSADRMSVAKRVSITVRAWSHKILTSKDNAEISCVHEIDISTLLHTVKMVHEAIQSVIVFRRQLLD